MASASTMGHIAVWDLEKKRLHSEIREAHKGGISGLKFLPNEPLLITSSSDNSIKSSSTSENCQGTFQQAEIECRCASTTNTQPRYTETAQWHTVVNSTSRSKRHESYCYD
ncbi:hypothetical protein AVEN_237430-1 [Araneus ventricosus]|uniref:Uncharacterized protein n=1 Tax=Araneus ventricosus TaxID=182803 RepID=A0A4Y2P7D2_ARAVE|nr:hypothetical protein AVEN_237430-1 [Araneus ventricosus]